MGRQVWSEQPRMGDFHGRDGNKEGTNEGSIGHNQCDISPTRQVTQNNNTAFLRTSDEYIILLV